jgi:hypothetical protein
MVPNIRRLPALMGLIELDVGHPQFSLSALSSPSQ